MIHDLDNILISPRIADTWQSQLSHFVASLRQKYPDLRGHEIPDEQFREFADGSGEIFIKIRKSKITLAVPAGEWEIKNG